ncbi:enolase C-terminal domain-like protein [soil metagenome]
MALIASVTTQPFRLPMKGELSWGKSSKLTALEHVLVRVSTDDGHTGVAEAQPRPTIYGETLESIAAIVKHHLAPKLIGLDVDDRTAVEAALRSVVNNNTARGAVDIALCQARARSKGRRLFDTYRGPQERVQVSYLLGIAELATLLAEAKEVVASGVRVLKVKVGRDKSHDARVLTALGAEFGAAVILYGDANEALEPKTAARDLEDYARLGLAYLDSPLPVEHFRARAALKAAGILAIIADESCFTVRDLRRELELDTFDILNVKPARTGYSDSLRMLRMAREADRCAMIGSQASSGLGTLHSAILASREGVTHPCELSFPLKLASDVMNRKVTFKDGYLEVSDLDGLALDEDKLAAASFDPPPG